MVTVCLSSFLAIDFMSYYKNPAVSHGDRIGAVQLSALDQTPHYVQAVMKVGTHNQVVAREDVYAANGMKLLQKGARVDNRLWESLGKHKLAKPLDLLLAGSDCVDHLALSQQMETLLAASPLLATMLDRAGGIRGLKTVLATVRLPAALAFRLTIMRDEAATTYRHSLRVAIGAYCIGLKCRLSAEQQRDLLLAAFCHDIGEMHTDPAILQPGRLIEGSERRFIHVHPITGLVILQQFNAIPPAVIQAVQQHHERMDGSGYPQRDRGGAIGILGRILAIAETLDAVSGRLDPGQIHIVFRMHQGRLDPDGMQALKELLPRTMAETSGHVIEPDLAPRIGRLAAVLNDWPAVRSEIMAGPPASPLQFVIERMAQVQSLACQAGIAPDLLELLDLSGDDAVVIGDLHTAMDELGRLLDGLAFEIDRCMPVGGAYGGMSTRIIDFLLH